MFNLDLNFAKVAIALMQPVLCFLILSILGMLVTYIVQIRGKLATLLVENLNLLNGMHEGLVMLSFNDRSLLFASTPAARLLN